MSQFFPINQFFYWLALCAWLGGAAFVTIAIPVVFRTVRENDPTLPTVLSVNLDGAHSSLLATTIILNLFSTLVRVELVSAGVLAATIAAQWAMLGNSQVVISLSRSGLFGGAVVILLYDWRLVLPRVWRYRKEYVDKADEPEQAKAAREQFERNYRESVTLLMVRVVLVSALVWFSTMISTSTTLVAR
jgi:hypothetical protein